MGLFDNLIKKSKDLIGQVKKTISNGSSNQTDNDLTPITKDEVFLNELVETYYKIIFDMSKSIDGFWFKTSKIDSIAKIYVEKQLNNTCEEDKLREAFDLFKLSRNATDKSKKAIFLREYNKEIKELNTYLDKKFDVINLCYQEEMKLIANDYKEILEVIKDSAKYEFLEQGLDVKIYEKYRVIYGEKITQYLIAKTIENSLIEENEIIKNTFINFVDTCLNLIFNQGEEDNLIQCASIIGLRSLHFKNDPDSEFISDKEYKELIINYDYYKNQLAQRPFEQDKVINEIISKLRAKHRTNYHLTKPEDYKDVLLVNLDRMQMDGYKKYINILRSLHINEGLYNRLCDLIWKNIVITKCGKNVVSNNVVKIVAIIESYYSGRSIDDIGYEDEDDSVKVFNTLDDETIEKLDPVDLD